MASAKIKGITIKLDGDNSSFRKSLQSISPEISKLQSELNRTDKAITAAMNAGIQPAEMTKQKMELLSSAIEQTKDKLSKLKAAQEQMSRAASANAAWEKQYEPLKKELTSTMEALKKLKDQQEDMNKKLSEGKIDQSKYDAYQKEIKETENRVKELKKAISDLDAQFADGHISAEQYRDYQREISNTEARLQSYQNELARTQNANEQTGNSTADVSQSFSDLKTAARKVQSDLASIASIAAKVGTAMAGAAAGAAAYSVNVGSCFEEAMSKVQAYSQASQSEFTELQKKAEEMGASTSKSATDSANALGYMALAGWDTEEMLSGLEPILRASEAGGADLALTSDLVTDSMSAMGIAVEDLNHYLDVCTAAQSNSNTSLTQLLEAYKIVGGTMKNLNVSVEESAALLGTLANRGKKGSEAGNALNSTLVNLIGANKNASTAMDTLGVSAWDAEGKFIGVTNTLKLLDSALASCTDEQKAMFEAQIGGKTQLDTLQALIAGVSEEYDELYATLSDSEGVLQLTAKTMQDNLKGSVTQMTSALEGLGVAFYDYLSEPIRGAVDTVTEQINNLKNNLSSDELEGTLKQLGDSIAVLIKRFGEFAVNEGIPALIDCLSWIANNIDNIIIGVKTLGVAWAGWKISTLASDVAGLITAFKGYSAAAATATVEQQALNTAMKANLFGLIATAAVAAATALAGFIDSQAAAIRQQSAYKTATEEAYLATADQIHAFADASEKADENARHIDELTKKLSAMTDENGNITASESQVAAVLEEINSLTGAELALVDGKIQGYNELDGTLQNYIETLRKQAKLEYYSTGYNEALANIDQAKAAEQQALQSYQNYSREVARWQDVINRDYEYSGYTLKSNIDRLEELKKKTEDAYTAWNLAQVKTIQYQRTINEYEEMAAELVTNTGKAAEGISTAENERQKASQQESERQAKLTANEEELKTEKELLDKKLKLHKISEEEYYSELAKILKDHVDRNSETWWEYYEDLDEYRKNNAEEGTETESATYAESLAAQGEYNDKYQTATEEQAENTVNTVSAAAESALAAGKEMLEDLEKAQEEYRQNQISDLKTMFDTLYSSYDEYYKDLENRVSAAAKKFMSIGGDVFSFSKDENGNKTLEIADIAAQMEEMQSFYDNIKSIKDSGASQSIIDESTSMSDEEAAEFAKYLASMDEKELAQISELYEKKSALAEELANELYKSDYEQLGNNMLNDAAAIMSDYSGTMQDLGYETMKSYILGLDSARSDLNATVKGITDDIVTSLSNGTSIKIPAFASSSISSIAGVSAGRNTSSSVLSNLISSGISEMTRLLQSFNINLPGNVQSIQSTSAVQSQSQTAEEIKNTNAGIQNASAIQSSKLDALITLASELSSKLDNLITAVNKLASRPIDITLNSTTKLDGIAIAKSTTKYQSQSKIINNQ